MSAPLRLPILPQPDDVTCGPTCLQAVYGFYRDPIPVSDVIREVEPLEGRGTMAVLLAHHALGRGYRATLYTYDLDVFDPTWFGAEGGDRTFLRERLVEQARVKTQSRLDFLTAAYVRFLDLGGELRYRELTPGLLVEMLRRGPVLTGLSATYLYGCAREADDGERLRYDDLRGVATGHFVVMYGFHPGTREVLVADPLRGNPLSGDDQHYAVGIHRLLGAIMLGVLTYDGNLLLLEPPAGRGGAGVEAAADAGRGVRAGDGDGDGDRDGDGDGDGDGPGARDRDGDGDGDGDGGGEGWGEGADRPTLPGNSTPGASEQARGDGEGEGAVLPTLPGNSTPGASERASGDGEGEAAVLPTRSANSTPGPVEGPPRGRG